MICWKTPEPRDVFQRLRLNKKIGYWWKGLSPSTKRMTGRKKSDRLKKIMCGDDLLCLWEYTGMILALQSPKKCHITWYWTRTLKTWFCLENPFYLEAWVLSIPTKQFCSMFVFAFFWYSRHAHDRHDLLVVSYCRFRQHVHGFLG